MLSRFGVTTAASGSLPTIQEQWPTGRITTGIAMPRSCMLRPRVRTSGTRNNSRRATVAAVYDRRRLTAGDLTQLRTVGGHFLGLRAAALALRVLRLRAAALALRVLGLRAAALALRVLGLRAAALALRVLRLRAAALALRVLRLRAAALALRGPPLQCYVHWSLESIFSE